METIFTIVSNPAVSAILGVVLTALISLLCRKFGWFAAIQPAALQALKAVEAAIPDDTAASAASVIDRALKVYIQAREAQGKTVSEAEADKARAVITEAAAAK